MSEPDPRHVVSAYLTRGACTACGRVRTMSYDARIDPADLRSGCCEAPVQLGQQSYVATPGTPVPPVV